MGCCDWRVALHSLPLPTRLWIYCSGHAGITGNEKADRLASKADITAGLQLGKAVVLGDLSNFPPDRLKERGVEKGSG